MDVTEKPMNKQDIKKMGEAWSSVVNPVTEEEVLEEGTMCESCGKAHEGKCNPADVEAYKKKQEDASNDEEDDGEGLDKADPKAAKKKFKDRKDKDIDNDGDVDSSDEYLHKRRKAVGKAMKKDRPVGNDGEKKAEISKIGEATEELLAMIESAAKAQKANATEPEDIMDKESEKSKQFAMAHSKSDKKIEDNYEDGVKKTTEAGKATKAKSGKRPQDNAAGDTNVVKSTEAPVKGGAMEAYVSQIRKDTERGSI